MPRTNSNSTTAANRLIRALLASLLAQTPRAARVSLSVLKADESQWEVDRAYYRLTNSALLCKRFDALKRHVVAVPEWQAMLASLQAGRCHLLRVGDRRLGGPGRRSPARAAHTLACPATDPLGDLAGAVFVVFETGARAPYGAELRGLKTAAARIGGQIAAVLDLVGQGPTQPRCATAA